MHYNAGCTYVKTGKLCKHKFGMETGTGSIMKYNFFVNPFTSLSFVTIHYNAGHTYTMQELVKEVTLIKP